MANRDFTGRHDNRIAHKVSPLVQSIREPALCGNYTDQEKLSLYSHKPSDYNYYKTNYKFIEDKKSLVQTVGKANIREIPKYQLDTVDSVKENYYVETSVDDPDIEGYENIKSRILSTGNTNIENKGYTETNVDGPDLKNEVDLDQAWYEETAEDICKKCKKNQLESSEKQLNTGVYGGFIGYRNNRETHCKQPAPRPESNTGDRYVERNYTCDSQFENTGNIHRTVSDSSLDSYVTYVNNGMNRYEDDLSSVRIEYVDEFDDCDLNQGSAVNDLDESCPGYKPVYERFDSIDELDEDYSVSPEELNIEELLQVEILHVINDLIFQDTILH